jgi:DNA-binding CsgD family transcriptional regulator/PAS domain-containing protein
MISQFNAWFKKTAVNIITNKFYDYWQEEFKDIQPVNPQQYIQNTKMFDLMANNKNTLHLLFDVKEFKVLYCSDNFEAMTGYSTTEILTKNVAFFFEIINKKDILFYFHFAKCLKKFMKTVPKKHLLEYGQMQWAGMTIKTKDGNEIETMFKINPFERDENGFSRLCIITLEDVSPFVKKNSNYWARIEAGTTKKYYSSFFEDDTKYAMKDILSERELEILKLVAIGKDSKEIAETFFLSIHTIDRHRKNMIAKMGVRDTTSLLEICRMCNLV